MATGKVDFYSDIKRKGWMREGILQKTAISFWNSLTGKSKDSVVYQVNNGAAGDGHTIVFDAYGDLSLEAVKGRDRAYGKGEEKTIFSDKLTVDRYRIPVGNGDKFDGVDIGNLNINEHADSRSKLADYFIRFKDQTLFDAAQGLNGQKPSHTIDLGSTFNFNTLLDIERLLKTSQGFTTGGIRRPLQAYMMEGGRKCWLFVMDSAQATMLKKDDDYQKIMYNADVRGDGNRLIKSIFGKIGSLLLVEADNFFGTTRGGSGDTIDLHGSRVEIAGLRTKDSAGVWTGQDGFSYATASISRGFIVGAGAFYMGFGKQPDYLYQESDDFKITSESAVEFWMNTQKVIYKQETGRKLVAEIAGIDYGIIAVDSTSDSAIAKRTSGASGASGASGQGASGASGEGSEAPLTPAQKRAATIAANAEAAAKAAAEAAANGGEEGTDGDGASGDSNENEGEG